MITDIVIPYRFSQVTRDQELRYALRGVEKHLSNVGDVYLIGDKPKYVTNCGHIPYKEYNWYTQLTRNIYAKLVAACLHAHVSDPFLYMNDDHFLLADFEADNIPYYHKGNDWTGKGKYLVTLERTRKIFPATNNFDTHAPMLIHKKMFLEAMRMLNWKLDFGYAIKTAYCASYGIRGQYAPDYKLDRAPTYQDLFDIDQRMFFSVGDKAMTLQMIFFLESKYPNKSKYEI
jgi:hypothetical protein